MSAIAIAALWKALEAAGLTEPRRLAALEGDERATVRAAVDCGDHENELVSALEKWVADTQAPAKRRHQVRAREGLQEALWVLAQVRNDRRRALGLEQGAGRALGRPPPPPVAKWPNRAARKLALATTAQARAEVEHNEVVRWADRAIRLVREAGLPAASGLVEGRPVASQRRHCAKGLRATTLRQHVRNARKAQEWVQANYGTGWFDRLEQVEDYLEERAAAAGAGPTSLGPVLMGIRYLEIVGSVPGENCFAASKAVKGFAASLVKDLAKRGDGNGVRQTTKAPMLPLKVLFETERYVMNPDGPKYLRAIAWARQVAYWAGLRGDDVVGIVPGSLGLDPEGD